LSPDPLNGGEGGGAGGSGAPAAPAPAFDASQYVPKSEFETRLQSEIERVNGDWESRYSELEGRLPKPAASEAPKGPPKHSDYDLTKEGQLEAFLDARAEYLMEKKFADRERQQEESGREESQKQYVQRLQNEHRDRAESFRAANPSYDPNRSFKIQRTVGLAILDSDFSAHIDNYLQTNPDKLKELRKIIDDRGPGAGVKYVGRLETMFEGKAAPAMPQGKPTRPAFSTVPGKTPTRGTEEIVKDWRM
jgi:hypothetical protein